MMTLRCHGLQNRSSDSKGRFLLGLHFQALQVRRGCSIQRRFVLLDVDGGTRVARMRPGHLNRVLRVRRFESCPGLGFS